MTKEEMIEVMEIYVQPLYNIIGAAVALFVLIFAIWFVLVPFIRRLKES